jgi:hypothetical protein
VLNPTSTHQAGPHLRSLGGSGESERAFRKKLGIGLTFSAARVMAFGWLHGPATDGPKAPSIPFRFEVSRPIPERGNGRAVCGNRAIAIPRATHSLATTPGGAVTF